MNTRFTCLAAAAWVAACLTLRTTAAPLQRVSASDPAQRPSASADGDSWTPIMTPDGRYVLFASTADNLVATTNGNPFPRLIPPRQNVYLRDRQSGTTTLISVNLSGTQGGNGNSTPAELSADGRYALFESTASDLVAGDTNNANDIFLRDVVNRTTVLVTTNDNGGVANGLSRSSVMTPDGRFVAFVSEATNLVADDTNGFADVFVRDLQSRTTKLVSDISTNFSVPIGSFEAPVMTPDGRYIVFYSAATNLSAQVKTTGEIYVRDVVSNITVWGSAAAHSTIYAVMLTSNAISYNHAISADGKFVVYEASPISRSPKTYPPSGTILRYSLETGLTDTINTNANVAAGLAPDISTSGSYSDVRSLDMTPDGRFVAFVANTNGNAGTTTCILVWDAQTGETTLVSGDASNSVPANSKCESPVISTDGRFVVFFSDATNLATNSLNGDYHLYLRDLQSQTTSLVDVETNGVGALMNPSTIPRLSADAHLIAFDSPDDSLFPDDYNHNHDVFIRDITTGTTELLSTRLAALPSAAPNGPSSITMWSLSSDGRYVAFSGAGDNLVANDTNGCRDVFVRDLATGSNLLVSVNVDGTGTDRGVSAEPAISGDGRYVVFTSTATNLVSNYTNWTQNVFLRDTLLGVTIALSTNAIGIGAGNTRMSSPVISADGQAVIFRTSSVGFNQTENEYLFARSLPSATTYALTPNGLSSAAISRNGAVIAFIDKSGFSSGSISLWSCQASSIIFTNSVPVASSVLGVSSDGNRIVYWAGSPAQIFVMDRNANTNWLIAAGFPASHGGFRFSSNGQFMTYAGSSTNNGTNQVYLYEFQSGANSLVSQGQNSSDPANGNSDSPDISPDGRFIAFRSAADNIVSGDTNIAPDVFLYDRLTKATTVLTASRFGAITADNRSLAPVFSTDGQALLFQSWASDLTVQDFNQSSDLFAYTLFYAAIIPKAAPAQGFWITWPVVPGQTYQVQFKDELNAPNWENATGTVTNIGTKAYFSDLASPTGHRFYRLVGF